MAHGYLGDGYGLHGDFDPDQGDDRDRGERGWRGRDDDWRDRNRSGDWRGHDRGMMFGEREREGSHEDRWSGREWRSYGEDRRPGQRGRADSYNRQAEDWSGQHRHSADPHDHYRSWRDRHMNELDRDYADYCRERERAFHQDFDEWRKQRHASYQPLRTGMTQSGISHDPSGELQLTTEATPDQSGTDPMGDATLGTNSQSNPGRGRR
jgi:hypothetical protein